MFIFLNIFIIIIFYLPKINSSNGDSSHYFTNCLTKCKDIYDCPKFKTFQFTWWYREQCFRCRQICIWNTVEYFKYYRKPIPKFNGKWPFIPITIKIGYIHLAIQEPASMFFSLFNAISFWKMINKIKYRIQNSWNNRNKWLIFGKIGLITWIASILFHSCDHWITETFDYCSAFALILYTFYISICFSLPLINSLYFKYLERITQNIFGIGIFSFYLIYLKIIYSKPIFDYSFHIKCCTLIGALTGIIFIFWIFFECLKGRKRISMLILISTLIICFISIAFDVFLDFPPIFWIFDAHSFFHLFSIPIPLLLSEFLYQEAKLNYKNLKIKKYKNL
ncbi:Post-GPI attachment to proteins factor 3 [Meloidogyne graminicola]|uniref:Post-GPI attachment to proteins factor 3 n=1 Tax=Meloidogyne graminicola TaxID=189291 RepID=A0A8S9ZZZ3_9BILA|nr:Post-GPI attachment to proteins factor 3 [Meloidogyne graminicola]